ncbi:hypothetical protein HFN60_33445 [Rhizobium leguminosarum]|uniref:hypothetical protein n=1 Tax=Rhizobium leguminosarum TaxID=384 RepID=UPI001C941B63|nr:hypothetical protein [Rhizobium leguminosarum]MBY5820491.1 hypothetical protein [Rhizobium leguminosarum]
MITREALYQLVWSSTGRKAAAAFGVSESFFIRVCHKLEVPRPPRGYWQKFGVGRAPEPPPLPPPGPVTEKHWSKSTRPQPPYVPPAKKRRPPSKPAKRGEPKHPLIAAAERHFQGAGPGADGCYLKPRKKLVVDVTASRTGLAKCLGFADRLFRTLEGLGHRVVIAPSFALTRIALDPRQQPPPGSGRVWSPLRPTVVFVDGMPIGLAVAEVGETVAMQYAGHGNFITKEEFKRKKRFGATWERERPVPRGKLKLTAYSPLLGVPWTREWLETAGTPLDDGLETIAAAIESGALELLASLERAGR